LGLLHTIENHKLLFIYISWFKYHQNYYEIVITIPNLPVELQNLKLGRYVIQGHSATKWLLWNFNKGIFDIKICYISFYYPREKFILCLQKFILKSKIFLKVLFIMSGYAWFLFKSLKDGDFHNQSELSMKNVFLNLRMLKWSSLRSFSKGCQMVLCVCPPARQRSNLTQDELKWLYSKSCG
jgi:hypothetical protein